MVTSEQTDSEYDFSAIALDRADWPQISRCQKLSEKFIERFADCVDWYWISHCPKLSKAADFSLPKVW